MAGEGPHLGIQTPRQRLSTPPLELPAASHQPVEDIIQVTQQVERQEHTPSTTNYEDIEDIGEQHGSVVEEPMTPSDEVVTEEEEDNPVCTQL